MKALASASASAATMPRLIRISILEHPRGLRSRQDNRTIGYPEGSVPKALDDLGVALVARAEREQLEALRPRFGHPRHPRREADRVHLAELDDLVVELDPAAAREHDVDLLGLVVSVGERLALAGLDRYQPDPERVDV